MKKIRTLIVDDEPLARQAIRLLLAADPEIEIIGEASNGLKAADFIQSHNPDLIFLDVQMPEMNGFEVIEKIVSESGFDSMPTIIFVTAYDEYAIRAFEVNALDYLLKPFSDERFEKTLERAKQQIKQHEIKNLSQKLIALVGNRSSEAIEPKPEKSFITRFMIKSGGRINFVKIDEIDWIEAADYYVKLHVGKKSHLIRESLNDLENRLDSAKFFRVHRSSIINLDRIKEMYPLFKGDYMIVLENGAQIKLSRSRRDQFLAHHKISG